MPSLWIPFGTRGSVPELLGGSGMVSSRKSGCPGKPGNTVCLFRYRAGGTPLPPGKEPGQPESDGDPARSWTSFPASSRRCPDSFASSPFKEATHRPGPLLSGQPCLPAAPHRGNPPFIFRNCADGGNPPEEPEPSGKAGDPFFPPFSLGNQRAFPMSERGDCLSR